MKISVKNQVLQRQWRGNTLQLPKVLKIANGFKLLQNHADIPVVAA